jgi:DNA-binding HxlR family transcriptional regulator
MDEGAATQDDARAGARVLTLLANPLNGRILRAQTGKPLRLAELHEKTSWPPQTTLRAAIGKLRALGLLERRELGGMPYGVANELSPAGEDMLFVADVVERWLTRGPQGPIPIDSDAGKGAIKALTEGWSSTMVRALASEPTSLTELDRRIPGVSYPSLERRLSRMRVTRQVEPAPGQGRSRPYAVTDWLRHSVAPLCAASRCERRHMREESAPITEVEIEAAFLLAVPLAPLPESSNGICILSVPTEDGESADGQPSLAGVTVEVERGAVVRCVPELERGVPTWALGSPMTWLDAIIEGRLEGLRFGGSSPQLAADLVHGVHLGLFGD